MVYGAVASAALAAVAATRIAAAEYTTFFRVGAAGSGLDMGYSLALAPQWRLGTRLGATLADRQHMQSYFGVDAQQAARSGYALYTPDAGLRDARLGVSLTYALNPTTFVTAAVSGSVLGDAARNSPITRSSNANSAVLAITHAF